MAIIISNKIKDKLRDKHGIREAFIPIDGDFHIRTAYEPNDEELRIYRKYGETQ
ncbi:hypothetical protein HF292_009530 [Acidithiobacillus ferruginosus]|uniref:Uncharacterized protein n=1 Tax=Acidithiobacillus ferruginosus TaxID=3063951 RepID=A0ACD5IE96_9PROT|nr:hypothetical protein [Acidithiobacillus ferruginosus]MBU2815843.1 hypothetical protein [Acidithiobacillus ferruginosus]